MTVTARFATHDDHEAVWRIRSQLIGEAVALRGEIIDGHAVAVCEHATMGWLLTPTVGVVVAEHRDNVVGLAVAEPGRYQGTSTRPGVVVNHLYVLPAYRGTRACLAMCKLLRQFARTLGAETVQLMVQMENRELTRQVLGNGYRPIGVVFGKEFRHGRLEPGQAEQAGDRASDAGRGHPRASGAGLRAEPAGDADPPVAVGRVGRPVELFSGSCRELEARQPVNGE